MCKTGWPAAFHAPYSATPGSTTSSSPSATHRPGNSPSAGAGSAVFVDLSAISSSFAMSVISHTGLWVEFSLRCLPRFFLPPNPQKSAQEHESYAAYEGHASSGWRLIGGLRGGCPAILFRHAFLVLLHCELDDLGQVQGAAVRGLGDLFATTEAIGD